MKPTIRNILWPTDFSPLSLAAADTARDLASRCGASLHVIHVAPMIVFDSTVAIETAGELLASEIDTRGPAIIQLDRLVATYFDSGPPVVRSVLVGTAWKKICDYAKSASIDLIVVSTHGLTGLQHTLIGSVTERVVRHAPGPVLVVKNADLASVP